MVPLSELEFFTVFSSLPPELRARIWHFAAFQPSEIFFQTSLHGFIGQHSQPDGPAILYASRESRQEAKRYYTPCRVMKTLPEIVWINFDADTFVFGATLPLPMDKAFNFDRSIMSRFQHLIIKTRENGGVLLECLTSLGNLLRYGNVKSLTVKVMVIIGCQDNVFLSRCLCHLGRDHEKMIAGVARRWKWAIPTVVEVGFRRKLQLQE